jgi:hypothetical protein
MTIGTGFVGRSSIGENLAPQHLVNWARIAYNAESGVPMGDFGAISPWQAPAGAVPAYPRASNDHAGAVPAARRTYPASGRSADPNLDALRAELRALVVEELAQLIKR